MDVLLQAAALLRKTIPQLNIRIVGNGPEYKWLQRICMELDLETVVQWFGETPLATLTEDYHRAHVFCLPSVQEGFGIVFLEAIAAGKPIVAALNDSRASRSCMFTEIPRSAIMINQISQAQFEASFGFPFPEAAAGMGQPRPRACCWPP